MKLNNLQILRVISALLVCCFHFRSDINLETIKFGDILFEKGSVGVPIFFVISGFIMAFTTQKMDFSKSISREISIFYKKRLIRIIPLYYLLTFAWMLLGGSFFLYFQGETFSRFYHSILFLPKKDTPPVLYLGWSLNYEIFFYLIFGISLIFKKYRYFFIIAFFIVTYILGLIFDFGSAYMQMVTSYSNLFFIAGILFALLLAKVTVPKKWAILISIIGILFFTLYLFKIIVITNYLLVILIISLFVLSFLLFDFTFHIKENRFLIFLGDISYSLYLSHSFVEMFFRKFKIQGYLNLPYLVLKLAIVIAVAAFFYYFVERKITEYLKLKLKV